MTFSQAAGNLEESPSSHVTSRVVLGPWPETLTVSAWTGSTGCRQIAVLAFRDEPSSHRASWSHWAWKVKVSSGNSTVTLFPWVHFLQLRMTGMVVRRNSTDFVRVFFGGYSSDWIA